MTIMVQQYVHEFIDSYGVACRVYGNFNAFHAAEVNCGNWEQGLPIQKAQLLVDAWNEALLRHGLDPAQHRYYLHLPEDYTAYFDAA